MSPAAPTSSRSRLCDVRLIFLGTGTSFGVPQIGCRCPTCTSADPRDRRTRAGALIETQGKRLLIDTPPELRLQLVAAGVDHIDAVLFTHAHADHVHGIDDLRALSVRQGVMLPAYGSRGTMAELASKFPYIFDPSIVLHAADAREHACGPCREAAAGHCAGVRRAGYRPTRGINSAARRSRTCSRKALI